EALTPTLARAATQNAATQAAAAPQPRPFELPPAPMPAFDATGRQTRVPGQEDFGHVAGLAQQLAGTSQPRPQAPAADDGRRGGTGSWSVGDLLTRASDAGQGHGGQGFRAATPPAQAASGGQLRLPEIAP